MRASLPRRRTAFTLVEVLVVVGIILLLTALSIPALNRLIGNRGIGKAARTAQTAIQQAGGLAKSLGRQHMVQFKNDHDGKPGHAVLIVMDGEEDLDGNGSPWTDAAGLWETADGKVSSKTSLPDGFAWEASPSLPILICMPDGSFRLMADGGPPYLSQPAASDGMAIRRAGGGDRYLLRFVKSAGRVKIQAE